MLDLYLIRHGQSTANEKPFIVGGQTNGAELTVKGGSQAAALGKRLLEERVDFDSVYASTAVRAKQTAVIACQYMGFPASKIRYSNSLLEQCLGDWEGKSKSRVYTPEVRLAINMNTWLYRPPNGESWRDVEARMHYFIQKLVPKEGRNTVALFTHGMAIKCFLKGLMECSSATAYKMQIHNTSITEAVYDAHGWRVVRINDHAHLPKKIKA
jgi:broad specificity phosphatase PhoE